MKTIDLRSDTVTRPTDAMREAMARVEVGDDVYGEDRTLNRLQEVAAARLCKPAAILWSTSTCRSWSVCSGEAFPSPAPGWRRAREWEERLLG